MLIANPIYDVVFKRLMENQRVAKFFIGTLLNQTIESVELQPQEFTYIDKLAVLSVFRLDFIAIIKTESGETKKVLIEIQKARNHVDLMRFRNYLAEQYKKEDRINQKKVVLPITTIYILGFKLPKIESACVHVERQYRDLINETILGQRSEFVEKLTHDSYVVQVERITGRYKSRLDKLLSVFEQSNFIDEDKVIKEYKYPTDVEDLKIITDILHHSGTDPESRREIDAEREAWRTVNAMMGDLQNDLDEMSKALDEKNKALEEQERLIEELKKKLEGK